jgi:hypothetical protein
MTVKTFTVAGTSNLNGVIKYRFANDLKTRTATLARNGHTEIQLVELPEAMTKDAAIQYLLAQGHAVQPDAHSVAPAVTDAPEVITVAPAITEDAIQARLAEIMENGRPRNARGHFVKLEELRLQVIAELGAA